MLHVPPVGSRGSVATRPAAVAATAIGLFALAIYRATLLPDFDLGDTASLQTVVGSGLITPRDGYPLYFALGGLILRLTRLEPAHALNLASVLYAAIACALTVLVAAELSGSVAAAAAAALLLAGSYTFWSQAVIAEVYTLHVLLVALTIWLILRWAERPTLARLTLFFGTYALGFGNHLSMVLLAPAFTVFLLMKAPGGWRSMFAPRVLGLAAACAAAGALPYVWNIRALWLLPHPPHSALEALGSFWFDVTKTDWRETMVMNVPRSMIGDRVAMAMFDVRQQFGWVGPLFATVGFARVAATNRPRACLLVLLYLTNMAFVLGYNVGDAHVFYLPAHLVIALLTAPGVATVGRLVRQPGLASLVLASYAGVNMHHAYPALDRSHDRRPAQVLEGLTAGLDDGRAILLTDVDWQLQNGLGYFTSHVRPQVAHARLSDVFLYAPALVADNAAIGRGVVLAARARDTLDSAYGPLLVTLPDPAAERPSLSSAAAPEPPRTRYVCTILKPTRDFVLDWDDLGGALAAAAGGRAIAVPAGDYVAIAGVLGEPPRLVVGSNRPFRRSVDLDGATVDIRMESWLAADTIRRMGFGHVVVGRQHTLIVERGVSFVAFDRSGRAIRTAYASNIFAPQPRYLVRAGP